MPDFEGKTYKGPSEIQGVFPLLLQLSVGLVLMWWGPAGKLGASVSNFTVV